MDKNFQEISIDWAKASKEYHHQAFESIEQIEKSTFLYKVPLAQTVTWLQEFILNDRNSNNHKNGFQQGANNIFSIVGERGTGKSSFIGTIRNSIENNVIFENGQKEENLNCFPTIDPTLFAGKIKLIESVLATMKNKVDIACKSISGNSFKDQAIHEKAQFDKKIKAIVKLLQDMRIEKSSYAENKTRVEVLDNLQNQLEFRRSITELIEYYLKAINAMGDRNYSHICLFIDDLDLVPNEIAYETLQDIFKFLQYQKKVVLFLAYREGQLINSVVDDLLADNKNILKRQSEFYNVIETSRSLFITAEEIKEQAANILEKGLPRAQRIYLIINRQTEIKDVLGPFVEDKNETENVFEEQTITAFIRKEVIKQTRLSIEPMDKMEITDLVYPKQLRSLLQYLEIIHRFHPFQNALSLDKEWEEVLPFLRKNIKAFKYFLLSRFRDTLNKNYMNIIDNWLERDYDSRNSLMVVSVLDLVKEGRTTNDFLPLTKDADSSLTKKEQNIYYKSSYNVSLGNVFTAYESFKMTYYGDVQALNFLYALKILYSIENLLLLTKSLNKFCSSKLVTTFYEEHEQNDIDFNLSKIISSSNTNIEEHEESIKPIRRIIEEIGLEQYFMLVRGKVMPDNFYYNDLFNGTHTEIASNLYYVQRLFFSNVSDKGYVKKYGETEPIYQPSEKYYSYKYRDFFGKIHFVKGNNYSVDPFAALTDMSYVLQVFHHIRCKGEMNDYLFYNIFDLDYFVRKNYSRQSQNDLFGYTFRRINNIFDNVLKTSDEVSFRNNMSIPLMANQSESNFVFKALIDIEKLEVSEVSISAEASLEESEQLINDFVINSYTEEGIYTLETYKVKDFLRNYWNVYKEWPDTLTDEENERVSKFVRPGNRYQISKIEKSYLKKIVTLLKEQGAN